MNIKKYINETKNEVFKIYAIVGLLLYRLVSQNGFLSTYISWQIIEVIF